MMVLDGHAFLGKSIYMENMPETLIHDMDRLGVESAVVVAPPPGPFYSEVNNFVRDAALVYPGRLVPIYRANPHLEGESERVREALIVQGFRGVQLDPTSDGYGVGATIMEPIVEVAGELEVPVYIHSGDSIFCHPEYVADFASRFEEVSFVTTFSGRAFRAIRDCSNVYLMSRPFPTLVLLRGRSEGIDLERLIFSSDSPMGSLELELRRVELADLDEDVKEKIMGGNLRRTIGI